MSITPFGSDGRIDESALGRHVRFLAERETGIFLGALTAGEGYWLTREEARTLYRIGVSEVGALVPVYAAAMENQPPAGLIDRANEAADLGCTAAQLYAPALDVNAAAWPEAVETALRQVLDATRIPLLLSAYPHGGGAKLPIAVVQHLLADYPNLIGVNVGGLDGDLTYLGALIESAGHRVPVRVAGLNHLYNCLALGGYGTLSYEQNVAPRLCASVIERYRLQDHVGARATLTMLAALSAWVLRYADHPGERRNMARTLKPLLGYLGFAVGEARAGGGLDEVARGEMYALVEHMHLRDHEGL